MSYDDVLYLWVGDTPPAHDFLSQEGLPEIPPMAWSTRKTVKMSDEKTADRVVVHGEARKQRRNIHHYPDKKDEADPFFIRITIHRS